MPVAQKKTTKKLNPAKRVLNIDEAAQYLGYTRRTLQDYVHARKIPYSKPSGKLYFDREALDEWMLSNPVRTSAQLDSQAAIYTSKHH